MTEKKKDYDIVYRGPSGRWYLKLKGGLAYDFLTKKIAPSGIKARHTSIISHRVIQIPLELFS